MKLALEAKLTIDTKKFDVHDGCSQLITSIQNPTKNYDETREFITTWKAKKDKVAAHTTKLMKEYKGNNAKCSTVK